MACKSAECLERKKKYDYAWRAANPDKTKKHLADYYNKHRDERSDKTKQHRARDPHHFRNKKLKANYGITLDDYNKMFQDQEGRCFICKKHELELKSGLVVDHDHKTGKVRGLLCRHCNSLLGYACDEVDTLKGAIAYLKERGKTDDADGR